jgi:hypothetical protein
LAARSCAEADGAIVRSERASRAKIGVRRIIRSSSRPEVYTIVLGLMASDASDDRARIAMWGRKVTTTELLRFIGQANRRPFAIGRWNSVGKMEGE